MSIARDELADEIAGHNIGSGYYSLSVGMDEAREMADAILAAGYRKIFDGDCGLSNVKDPTDREASEAWMRWANLVSGNGHDGIAAMKQMLTEFGYRKPRAVTTAEDLDALPVQAVIRGKWLAEKWADEAGELWYVAGKGMRWDTEQLVQRGALPATVLHEPEATA